MADILIQRCTVRVVRHGGWAWGEQPRALLDGLRRAVISALSAELGQALAGTPEAQIAAPMRLRIPVTLRQLAAFESPTEPDPAAAEPHTSLQATLREAVRRAVALHAPRDAVPPSPDLTVRPPGTPHSAPEELTGRPTVPLRVMLDWLRAGRLRGRLDASSTPALRRWYEHAIAGGWASGAAPDAGLSQSEVPQADLARLARQAQEAVADIALAEPERAALLARLLVIVTLEDAMPGTAQGPAVREALERQLPAQGPADTGTRRVERSDVVDGPGGPLPAPRRMEPLEWRVATALPFLLLGPLAGIGWLDAVAAGLEAEGAGDLLPVVGAALACKMLPPPKRGWARGPSAGTTAAAAGLLALAPEADALHRLCRAASDELPGWDGLLADSLSEGHRPGAPLLLTPLPEGGLLLADSDGLFPIAVAADVEALGTALRRLQGPVLAPDAGSATLATLDALGVSFVTDAAPGRQERWRRLPLRDRAEVTLWTNDNQLAPGNLGDLLAFAPGLARDAWQAIAVERPATIAPADGRFEASLGLAACLGLGSIAWALWRERETATPLLALDRFADFEALVRADAASVTVSLPMGRRFLDLQAHGLLADVRDVPWFGGRILQFRSG